jgi:hypothetical protein
MKACGKCKENKPFTEYHKATREKSGYQQWCKLCRKEHKHEERKQYHRNRYHKNKDNYLDWTYQRHYGITLEAFNQFLQEQDAVCAICKQVCNSGRRLAVDHDHSTGVVRGLLCGNCNKGLGCFKDSPELLNKAAEYLGKQR